MGIIRPCLNKRSSYCRVKHATAWFPDLHKKRNIIPYACNGTDSEIDRDREGSKPPSLTSMHARPSAVVDGACVANTLTWGLLAGADKRSMNVLGFKVRELILQLSTSDPKPDPSNKPSKCCQKKMVIGHDQALNLSLRAKCLMLHRRHRLPKQTWALSVRPQVRGYSLVKEAFQVRKPRSFMLGLR